MKPENHAIRQLEKQLAEASPEVRAAGERVILALKACLLNYRDKDALTFCRLKLAEEVSRFEGEIMKSKK